MGRYFEPSLAAAQPLATSVLEAACQAGRLAHAYLLTGRHDADKWRLSNQLARALNCARAGDNAACRLDDSACQNCRWIAAREHPQAWLVLEPEGSRSGKIAVEKSRALAGELARTSQFKRMVVIPDASEQTLHRPAANALLKTIEEPQPGTTFMLFAAHEDDVLPTIVSRCQIIPVCRQGEPGIWLPESIAADDMQQLRSSVAALTSRHFRPGQRGRVSSVVEALEWGRQLADLISDSVPGTLVVDLAAMAHLEQWRGLAPTDARASALASAVLDAAEQTKNQMERYVATRPALEAFALRLSQLGAAD